MVTNDIYTDEDARFLRSRVCSTRTGSARSRPAPARTPRSATTSPPNLIAVEDLEADFAPLDVVLVESGGDNLTATFSPALVDAQIFVLDVAGGGDVARKGGPGIARADLLVVNKTDLAPYVGVDVPRMVPTPGGPDGPPGAGAVAAPTRVDARWRTGCGRLLAEARAGRHTPVDPGPMAPHVHGHAH